MIKKWAVHLLFSALVLLGLSGGAAYSPQHAEGAARYDDILYFPASRYPETGAHISDAIKAGHSDVCTIERSGADKRRQESLKGIPTKPGFDRDEWPMAMCAEGGAGASVGRTVTIEYKLRRAAGAALSECRNGFVQYPKVD